MTDITSYLPVVEVDPALVRKDEIIDLTGDSGKLHEQIGILGHYAEFLSAWTSRWLRTSKS